MSNFFVNNEGYIVCNEEHDLDKVDSISWCHHLAHVISEGLDASDIEPGSKLMVPIFPKQHIWIQVEIEHESYGPAHKMSFTYLPDYGNEIVVQLGFWCPGEGRLSIRSVILEWLKGQVSPADVDDEFKIHIKCPSTIHNVHAQNKMDNNKSPEWKWKCIWYIVLEKACTTCIEWSFTDPDDVFNGLGDVSEKPPWRK